MNRFKLPLHPFLLTLYAFLSLYVRNQDQVRFEEAAGVIFIGLAAAGLFWCGLDRVLRNRTQSAILTSVFMILFLSFGPVLSTCVVLLNNLGRLEEGLFLTESTRGLVFWLCLFAIPFWAVLFLAIKSRRDFKWASDFLNVFSVALLLMVAANWVSSRVSDAPSYRAAAQWDEAERMPLPAVPRAARRPNIYYIILDAYARSDILKTRYDLDNSAFVAALKARGFYVADQSRSNYGQTALSLASSLNSVYLDDLVGQVGPASLNRVPLAEMIAHSRVARRLRDQGYRVTAFSTGFPLTEMREADRYLAPSWNLTGYTNTFINTTPLPLLLRLPMMKTQYEAHREQILYTLDHLADAAEGDAPTFVFAHLVVPHPPFVFGPKGEPIDSERRFDFIDGSSLTALTSTEAYTRGYRDQVKFISPQIVSAIDRVLARSAEPPIIILQGDHGPGSNLNWQSMQDTDLSERMSILNAYLLPGREYGDLYPSITPVNTFRVVLDRYMGTHEGRLKDESYFSQGDRPYAFVDVTKRLLSRGPTR